MLGTQSGSAATVPSMLVGSGVWFGVCGLGVSLPDEVAGLRDAERSERRAGARPAILALAAFSFAAPCAARRTEQASSAAIVCCARFTGKERPAGEPLCASARAAINCPRRHPPTKQRLNPFEKLELLSPPSFILAALRIVLFAER